MVHFNLSTLSVVALLAGLTLGCDDGGSVDPADGGPLTDGVVPPADTGPAPDGSIDGGPPVAYDTPPLPDFDTLPFPHTTDGRVLIESVGGFTLYVRPDEVTPTARLGRCVYTLSACLAGPGEGDVDACMRSAPVCADPNSADALPCCPAECVAAYAQQRAQGAAPQPALDASLFADESCVPGVAAALRGEEE